MIISNLLELETRSQYIVSLPLSHKNDAIKKVLTTNSKNYESSTLVQQENFRTSDREKELLLMTEKLEHENRYR